MNLIHLATILAISASLAGCDGLDAATGTPSFQENQQRIAAINLSAAAVPPVAVAVSPAPVVAAVPQPECTEDSFRIYRCVSGHMGEWAW